MRENTSSSQSKEPAMYVPPLPQSTSTSRTVSTYSFSLGFISSEREDFFLGRLPVVEISIPPTSMAPCVALFGAFLPTGKAKLASKSNPPAVAPPPSAEDFCWSDVVLLPLSPLLSLFLSVSVLIPLFLLPLALVFPFVFTGIADCRGGIGGMCGGG